MISQPSLDRSPVRLEPGRSPLLYNIQALRAVAALMVVLFHVSGLLEPTGFNSDWVNFGQRGVDLFFVISGYVMVYTTSRKPVSGGAFFLNRVFRIVPLYWSLTLPLGIAAIVAPSMFKSFEATPQSLIKSLAFIPFLDSTGKFVPVLFVGWTLNYEMFFYALFAIALTFARRSASWTAIATLTMLSLIAGFGIVGGQSQAWEVFYTNSIILEFGFGMLLALLIGRAFILPRLVCSVLVVSGFILLILFGVICPQLPRVIGGGLPAAAIVSGAVGLELDGQAARNRQVQTLGASSYALYLIHPIITSSLHRVSMVFASPVAAVGVAIIALAASLIGAVLLHIFLERPLGRFLRRFVGHRPAAIEVSDPSPDPMDGDADGASKKRISARG